MFLLRQLNKWLPNEKPSSSYEDTFTLDKILELLLPSNTNMLTKEENKRGEIMETKTHLKRTIEINNIDNGTIDLEKVKSGIDNKDAKINMKHVDGSLKVEINDEK